jgi:hypothetical protein
MLSLRFAGGGLVSGLIGPISSIGLSPFSYARSVISPNRIFLERGECLSPRAHQLAGWQNSEAPVAGEKGSPAS